MPELPEVECIRRTLAPRLIGHTITLARLHRRDVLILPTDPAGGIARQRSTRTSRPDPHPPTAANLLGGCTITQLDRRGKQLAIIATDPRAHAHQRILIIQLGMSGQLIHHASTAPPAATDHIHAAWQLDNGTLFFRDPRRFGALRALPSLEALARHWQSLGPDALTLTPAQLAPRLARSSRAIKAALLDQAVTAGVGNIYADEALFAAGIRPTRRARALKPAQIDALAAEIRAVLARAIDAGGSTLRDYVDAQGDRGRYQTSHAVYGRAGLKCPRCARTLSSTLLAQRTTVWCRSCQR